FRIGRELRRLLRVRSRREAADPRERVEVVQPEVQRLTAAHRETRERAVRAIAARRVARLDERNQVVEQLALERGVGLELDAHSAHAAGTGSRTGAASAGTRASRTSGACTARARPGG